MLHVPGSLLSFSTPPPPAVDHQRLSQDTLQIPKAGASKTLSPVPVPQCPSGPCWLSATLPISAWLGILPQSLFQLLVWVRCPPTAAVTLKESPLSQWSSEGGERSYLPLNPQRRVRCLAHTSYPINACE